MPQPLQYTEIAAYARANGQDVEDTFALVSRLDDHMVIHLIKASNAKGKPPHPESLGG